MYVVENESSKRETASKRVNVGAKELKRVAEGKQKKSDNVVKMLERARERTQGYRMITWRRGVGEAQNDLSMRGSRITCPGRNEWAG
jgi:hypothetical protein